MPVHARPHCYREQSARGVVTGAYRACSRGLRGCGDAVVDVRLAGHGAVVPLIPCQAPVAFLPGCHGATMPLAGAWPKAHRANHTWHLGWGSRGIVIAHLPSTPCPSPQWLPPSPARRCQSGRRPLARRSSLHRRTRSWSMIGRFTPSAFLWQRLPSWVGSQPPRHHVIIPCYSSCSPTADCPDPSGGCRAI